MATNETPNYWSIDPATFDTWVNLLGYAAAGKLMAACAAYMLHGALPEGVRLNKAAQTMFDGERAKLDRRRASALNGAKRGRKDKTRNVENPTAASVENPENGGKPAVKSGRSSGKVRGKSAKNPTPAHGTTCGNANPSFKVIKNRNRNINPQTPAAPEGGARGFGAGASNVVTPEELAAMVAAGLGYDSPTAYGMRTV